MKGLAIRTATTWVTGAMIALLCACTNGEVDQPIGEEIPPDPVLVALEAYRGEDQYFLRYRRGEEVYYASGNLRGRASSTPEAGEAGYGVPAVKPMVARLPDDWNDIKRSMTRIPILGIAAWAEFRDSIFAEFLPARPDTGVAVSFDREDFFFFYDSSGLFRARRLIEKPPRYTVSAHVDLQQYFDKWQPLLKQYLEKQKVDSHEVLFNTGDLDKGSIPFVYVNTREKLIVLIRYDELPHSLRGVVPVTHILQSLWHFVGGHSYYVPMRPFSSVKTLLALLSDTAIESGKLLLPGMPLRHVVPPLTTGVHMDLGEWERELDRRLDRPSGSGMLDFLVDGTAFFTRFIDEVTSAQSSVDVRAYIFDNDDVALMIAELLKRRSREGIDVRVLFDGLGTAMAGGERAETLPGDHRAPLSIRNHLSQDSRVKVRSVKNIWLSGDHVKTMVIDRRTAFLGGMNIGREYRYDWHDLMVEITGPVVDEINAEFDSAWIKAGIFGDFGGLFRRGRESINQDRGGYPVRLIYTRPGQQEIYALQRDAIRRSRGYIYIENAYFTDDALLRELILARRRGVDVRVIIPLETDRGMITRNIVLAANAMLEHGIRVFIYPGFTHAKAAIFDGWASVGTANLDRLSLKINQEINIATSEPSAVQELLDELFKQDFQQSTELTEPLDERWTDHLIEMFGDYLF
ncbi:MAG: phosphatidylserine/phosphatidylglycerophosphate/cardiolipin synthase family protein [Halioglobus sp.]